MLSKMQLFNLFFLTSKWMFSLSSSTYPHVCSMENMTKHQDILTMEIITLFLMTCMLIEKRNCKEELELSLWKLKGFVYHATDIQCNYLVDDSYNTYRIFPTRHPIILIELFFYWSI